MSDHPVFHFRSSKEKPKTFIQLKFKNNTVEFNFDTEFEIKINDKKYILDTNISLKSVLNNEPEITINYNVKEQYQINFNVSDLLLVMNDFKSKVENDIQNVENENNNKLQIQEKKFMEFKYTKEKEEKERIENERLEKERIENERLEKERIENERLEKEIR